MPSVPSDSKTPALLIASTLSLLTGTILYKSEVAELKDEPDKVISIEVEELLRIALSEPTNKPTLLLEKVILSTKNSSPLSILPIISESEPIVTIMPLVLVPPVPMLFNA